MFKIILTIGSIQALAVCVQFIKSKMVAVYLGPAGVGVVGTIDQFVQLIAYISSLSLPAASIKFLSKSHSEGQEAFKRSYAGFFKLLFLLSVAGAVLTAGTTLLKPDLLGEQVEKYKLF
jgi:O-antigen/teichoic acid export membrane protein